MSLDFAIEPLEKCWTEWLELASLQWQETEGHRHEQVMAPSFERYNQYDKAGWFVMFTARDNGRLVGSCGCYLVPSMHSQALIATEDTWFMRKEYRKGRNAIDFYKFGERELIKRGAVSLDVSSKIIAMLDKPSGEIKRKPSTGRLLEYLGYESIGVQYYKSLVRPDRPSTGEVRDEPVRETT